LSRSDAARGVPVAPLGRFHVLQVGNAAERRFKLIGARSRELREFSLTRELLLGLLKHLAASHEASSP
jgi:hypothetical protein